MPRSPDYLGAVGIGVSDLARSVDFYTRVLGMTQVQTFKLDYMDEVVVAFPGRSAVVLMHYTDGSVRNYQRKSTQWTMGKNFDATGAFGPCLVTADELPPGASGLTIQGKLNGVVMQSSNTSDMIWGVADTIVLLTECMTLEPGDVIIMGTPGGVGAARKPPLWMKHGDVFDVEIERIGVLSNPIRDEKAP